MVEANRTTVYAREVLRQLNTTRVERGEVPFRRLGNASRSEVEEFAVASTSGETSIPVGSALKAYERSVRGLAAAETRRQRREVNMYPSQSVYGLPQAEIDELHAKANYPITPDLNVPERKSLYEKIHEKITEGCQALYDVTIGDSVDVISYYFSLLKTEKVPFDGGGWVFNNYYLDLNQFGNVAEMKALEKEREKPPISKRIRGAFKNILPAFAAVAALSGVGATAYQQQINEPRTIPFASDISDMPSHLSSGTEINQNPLLNLMYPASVSEPNKVKEAVVYGPSESLEAPVSENPQKQEETSAYFTIEKGEGVSSVVHKAFPDLEVGSDAFLQKLGETLLANRDTLEPLGYRNMLIYKELDRQMRIHGVTSPTGAIINYVFINVSRGRGEKWKFQVLPDTELKISNSSAM